MHPFYDPSRRLVAEGRSSAAGLVSMVAYLAFWAGAIVLARRMLDERFPQRAPASTRDDDPVALVRMRYARGEIDRDQYLQLRRDLEGGASP